MPAPDPNTRAHLEWLGFIQPNGLVVSAPALAKAGAILNQQDMEGQRQLLACIQERELDPARGPEPCIPDFREFAAAVLDWGFSPRGYAGTVEAPVAAELELPLPDYGETLRPDFAVRERDPRDGEPPWQLLVHVLDAGQDFDAPVGGGAAGPRLEASPHGRAERLLRGTGVSAGLLFNGVALRLISAPRGESSGWMDFRVADMSRPAGRPLCSALRLLLSEQRLLALPHAQRLAALLEDSRKYQNEVSERLSEQVMHALYELLRGLQAAHDASGRDLLREPLSEDGDRDDIYRGLLSVILRLVFLLYAEERGMLPEDDTFIRHYSLTGLYQRLREDAALHPDTMDQRFGAWAQFLVLFRLIHDGARSHRTGGAVTLPERRGALFDPDRFPFLEGRHAWAGVRQSVGRVQPPLVSDGAVYRVLEKLLVLDGERISYRTLDVEQIGSVYETIMGFRMEVATGPSIAIKPAKKLGAPNTIDLDALLAQPTGSRASWLRARADRNVTDTVSKGLRAAETVDDLHAALDRVLDKDATPDLVPPGALVLQPNEERRRSGSHYTPRELTEPIVRHTLAPILERLRREASPAGSADSRPASASAGPRRASLRPAPDTVAMRPEQILDLKVCDPAMGSGAFLVEACRQLADALIEAWGVHGEMPSIPPDEDEVIHARRLVAQRCLYGIDRNPMAVDLAKVSLWLSTLARDHPLTFIDHAFRHGDSLVGLTRRQIEAFHWLPDTKPVQAGFEVMRVRQHVAKAAELRRRIREAGEEVSDQELHDLWHDARNEIDEVRLYGDLALAAFFAEAKPKQREAKRLQFTTAVAEGDAIRYLPWLEELRDANPPLAPFHWEIEFPEVFDRENPGFDAFVGNPPFAGKNAVAAGNVANYPDWLKSLHEESHGNADVVAHFYRRAFNLVRDGGTLGLIATNTIAQGDTRSSGLRWICEHGGEIYRATKRVKWPGEAAVVVSVLHLAKTGTAADDATGFAGDELRRESSANGGSAGSKLAGEGSVTGSLQRPHFVRNKVLDSAAVENITAFLFHCGGHADPVRLEANAGKSFVGSYVLGMGFTFDDTDKKGVASPLAEMHRLIDADLHNREAIFPYIGGEEVNTSPTHAHHRYVINFRDYPLRREPSPKSWSVMDDLEREECLRTGVVPEDYPDPVAADWPDLLTIIEQRVKPERKKLTGNPIGRKRAEFWWRYGATAKELYAAITGSDRVLAISRYGQVAAFTLLPPGAVYSDSIIVFPFATYAAFCTLQSRPHEIWARFLGSSMKDDLRYTPSDCFETFPFPDCTPKANPPPGIGPADGTGDIGLITSGDWSARATGQPDGWASNPNLEAVGQAYYEYRAALMVRNGEGLTKTYNRFHDPYEDDPEIGRLRELHDAMDRAVLDAYGWSDLPTECEFLLDYEIDEATWGRKKKPYRYRWPDYLRDDVLARLLALNAERAAEEARSGTASHPTRRKSTPGPARSRYRQAPASDPNLMVAEPQPLWPTSDD